jgi:hypothetical protein
MKYHAKSESEEAMSEEHDYTSERLNMNVESEDLFIVELDERIEFGVAAFSSTDFFGSNSNCANPSNCINASSCHGDNTSCANATGC